ncbi:ABC transporter permease [Terriglobus tenax]|uniref:ABC transporter permease n=1 Tax=Terriglobus tenax TaxID=1111115 RepID=UPI0021E092FC|nr:ABC transporter permease [Terriglobus tenax]
MGNAWAVAVSALKKNKLQTTLTMTGMTVGIATVLTMIALGTGAQAAIQDQVRAAGMNLLVVTSGNYRVKLELGTADGVEGPSAALEPKAIFSSPPKLRLASWKVSRRPRLMLVQEGSTIDPTVAPTEHDGRQTRLMPRPGDAAAGRGAATTLSIDDANAIRAIKGVQYVSSGIRENVLARSADATGFTSLHGEEASLPQIRRAWVFPHGRFFSRKEEERAEHVAVLGKVVSDKIFGNQDPVGKEIVLKDETFRVVGVIGSGSWMIQPAAGDDQFDAIYIPVTAMQQMLHRNYLDNITVTTESTGDVTRVSKVITALLRQRHHIGAADPDDFGVNGEARKVLAKGGMRPEIAHAVVGNVSTFEKVTLDQLSKTLEQASATMTALLISIAAVSLIVGGIGIMNVMLLSVSQRIREIGIRRAVGARTGDVLNQFLLEAVALSLSGGVAGVTLGCVAAQVLSQSVKWSTHISLPAIAVSFFISVMIGIFFGYYPAKQASRVVPMESLRYE